jgi:dipeptidyl aminopeptidase/acylaminoacyl peptidase
MRLALWLLAQGLAAQPAPVTLDQVMSAPFPSELTASPARGGAFAWVSNVRGVRNVMVAAAPGYRARAATSYTADDGQEIAALAFTPDGGSIVYVRGGDLNPEHDPHGVEQAVWVVAAAGGAPRKIAEGDSPSISPKGDRVAFVRNRQIWWAPLDGSKPAARAFEARGGAEGPVWSPDGARIAFTSARGDHSLIGVYTAAADKLSYVDPSTDYDREPVWSPDSRSVAFLREPSDGLRAIRVARRAGEPWSIRIADVETGQGRELWRAREGRGSVFRQVSSNSQLHWTPRGRIVFPWEGDGWTHLYSMAATGGTAAPLTPGEFEVEDVAVDGERIVYSSNQGDIDRRHLWTVAAGGGAPRALTAGEGIECEPAAAGGLVAFLRGDAQRPLYVAMGGGNDVHDVETLPASFPLARMVTPRQVVFPSADGLPIHGQLFLPPNAPAKAPALVFFHGGSRRQMLLGWHPMYYYSNAYALNQYFANAGYIVLSVNYRSGIGYGLDFREALNYGPSGGSEYNDEQGAGVYLRGRADVDPGRIGTWGGSYGGYLVAMALARSSDLYRAGVDFHGVHDWAREIHIPPGEPDYRLAFESSPMHYVDGWRSPVLLMQGDADPDVQFNQTVMLYDALRRRKVDVERIVFPDESHDFLLWRTWREAYAATAGFFARKLK